MVGLAVRMRQTGFTSLYVLAVDCAATGAVSALIMPELNILGSAEVGTSCCCFHLLINY
jgi:hypothetical protein